MITRFAPSPTGDLHLGGAYVALASWWMSRSYAPAPGFSPSGRENASHHEHRQTAAFVLRVEDLDSPRVVAGSAERILEDLRWLGLDWDRGPFVQSERLALYDGALGRLRARGLVYPCDCSRADIARAASAPHAGEETVYPGTCRDRDPGRAMKRPPALRLRVPDAEITVVDEIAGPITQHLVRDVGDLVLRRGDGVYAYQLVVVVDDLEMGITDVVRGADLLGSTPRQACLAGLPGAAAPRFHHVPLVVDANGERLAKRTAGARVRDLREAGISAKEIVGELGCALGLRSSPSPCAPEELLRGGVRKLAPYSFRIPARWAAL